MIIFSDSLIMKLRRNRPMKQACIGFNCLDSIGLDGFWIQLVWMDCGFNWFGWIVWCRKNRPMKQAAIPVEHSSTSMQRPFLLQKKWLKRWIFSKIIKYAMSKEVMENICTRDKNWKLVYLESSLNPIPQVDWHSKLPILEIERFNIQTLLSFDNFDNFPRLG